MKAIQRGAGEDEQMEHKTKKNCYSENRFLILLNQKQNQKDLVKLTENCWKIGSLKKD